MGLSKLLRVGALVSGVAVSIVTVGPLGGTASAARPPAPVAPSTATWPASPSNNPTPSFTWTAPSTGYSYVCSLDKNRVPCAADAANALSWRYDVTSTLTDGAHTFAVRTKVVGHRPITTQYGWTVDTVPPAAPSVVQPPAQTRATSVSISFSDSDPSVDHLTCSLDGATPTTCVSPFTKSGLTNTVHHLVVAAFDLAGNSASSTVSWEVNPTAPDYPVVTGPSSPTNSTSASVSFQTTNAATFTCTLDNPDPTAARTCTSPASLSGLADGTHTYTVWATDSANNTWSNFATWVVDTAAPHQPVLTGGPSPVSDDTSPTIWFSEDPDLTGVHFTCTVSDVTAATVVAGPQPCASPYDFNLDPSTPDGHHFRAHIVPTDGAGNVGPALDVDWTLDQTISPSPIVWLAAPASPSNVLRPTFGFNAPDAGQPGGATGFRCALDSDAFTACGTPDSITGDGGYTVGSNLSNGPHTFVVETTSGSAVSQPMTWHWVVDATPPPAPVVSSPGVTPNPVVTFSDGDPTVTFLCSIDGGPFVPCTSPWTPPAGLTNGSHTLVVEAVDQAGNATPSAPITFVVGGAVQSGGGSSDTTPPTVSSIATPSSLTGSALVTFSETVQGLATYGVVYSVTGSTTVLPARVTCLSSGAPVSCSSTFTAVRLAPSGVLVPGQHYTVLVMAGATHDLAGNASVVASRAFRGAQVLEEDSVAVHSRWATRKSASAFGGSYVTERRAGATAAWSFVGPAVTWWTLTGPDQGRATVYVDGVRRATVDNFAAARHFRVARVVKGLKNTSHLLVIRVAGVKGAKTGTGTSVAVDAFTVGKVRSNTPAVLTQLRRASSSHYLAGRALTADLAGATVTLTFRGTGVAWWTVKGRNQGKVAVYVDGARKLVLDNYARSTTFRVRRVVNHLSDTVHTLKLVVLGTHHRGASGTWVTFDRFSVT